MKQRGRVDRRQVEVGIAQARPNLPDYTGYSVRTALSAVRRLRPEHHPPLHYSFQSTDGHSHGKLAAAASHHGG
jgi:hypothetical protein